jgi:tetratricopeptide (TPR) repeat protein
MPAMRNGLFWMAGAALALAGCATSPGKHDANPASSASAPPAAAQTRPDLRFDEAAKLLHSGKVAEGRAMFREIVSSMPASWQAVRENTDSVAIAYWDQQEFLECSQRDAARYKKNVLWTPPSYAQAWYLLAFFAIENKDNVEAEADIDRALALEPDRALLLNEKATIVQQSPQRLAEAVAINRKAVDSTQCTSAVNRKKDLSRAWRSMGVALIDLHKWDEADAALEESLKVDPGNPGTINEFVYLERMRGKKPPKDSSIVIKRAGQ